ncbi:MAG: P-loop NTPase [Candidatus Aenigmatarchaeota archaeon]
MVRIRIISIMSTKGGVGKTTIASNLALALQNFGKKTALVDFNFTTPHVSLYFNIFPTKTLNNFLRNECQFSEILHNYNGLTIIPSSLLIKDVVPIEQDIKRILEENLKEYEFVILDSAPGLGREAISALKSSKEVLLVSTPLVSTILDVVRAQEVLREIGVKPIGIVLNMVTGASYEMRKEEIEQLTGLPVLVSIPYDKNVYRSTALKQPVYLLNPNSSASKEILRLASILTGENIEIRKSFFERLGEKFKVITSHLI